EMRADLQAALTALAPPPPPPDEGFERQLRRRRLVAGLLAAPLAIGAPAMAGWAGLPLWRSHGGVLAEQEPNDRPALAAPLARRRTLQGFIGPARDGHPDFDYYRIPPGPGPRAVTAQVSGVTELDLVLELY